MSDHLFESSDKQKSDLFGAMAAMVRGDEIGAAILLDPYTETPKQALDALMDLAALSAINLKVFEVLGIDVAEMIKEAAIGVELRRIERESE